MIAVSIYHIKTEDLSINGISTWVKSVFQQPPLVGQDMFLLDINNFTIFKTVV